MAEKFRILDDYQHARLRTEMYLGSREEHTQEVLHFDGTQLTLREFTWIPALYTAFRELLDNALDEMIGHGHGDTLRIDYDPQEMVITVEDNGRGIPIDEKPELGKGPAASILLGQAKAGRNFDERQEVAGVNGLGAAIVNFTSEWFQLDVWRSGKHFRQKWQEGTYRGKEIHKTSGPTITKGSKARRGTRVQFKPSSQVYPKMLLPPEFIESRVWDIAVANPGLKVYLNGNRVQIKNARDPIQATYFDSRTTGVIEIKQDGFVSRFYVSPGFADDREVVHSVVNNIPVFQGGSHVDTFRKLFCASIMENLAKQTKKENLTLRRDDVMNGLLILNFTTMSDAKFDSQTKVRLISEVQPKIKAGFSDLDVKAMLRRNPKWIEQILERARSRSSRKEQREVSDEQKKLKKQKVASLHDATGRFRQDCTLFLAEGESAIAGMISARNPVIHGGIGLRGKIMNVHGVTPKKVLASNVLVEIMISLGLELGVQPARDGLRYGSVYIATDEDEDGKNITALLVNFFYTFWPSLFQDPKRPFVFKFSTPFIILTKGNTRKYIYAHDYEQFQHDLEQDKYKGWKVTRAKGLGRLTKTDWEHALAQPVLVPVLDDGKMKDTLDLIFNKDRTDDRKGWLE